MKKISPIKVVVGVLALTFLIHQFISSVYKPITTESAQYYTSNDGFDINGIVIRNEKIIKSKTEGVLHFLIDDGSRVSKDGTIANIYKSEEASIILSEIDATEKKIKDIENIMSINNIEASNLDAANTNVKNNLNDLILSSSFGNFGEVNSKSEELLSALNRKQAILGETSDFSEQLKLLNSNLKTLNSSLENPIGKIKADRSGYFLSVTDGYEKTLDISDLSVVTPEFLNNISKDETDSNAIGKIVSDYEWYIAAEITVEQSLNFKEGDSLSLYTSVKSASVLPVTVKKINISKDGSKAVIIFACSNMNSDLAAMRTGVMTVVKNEYSGLKVSKKALRVVNSVRGVYVVNGMQVKFVPVEIIYTNDDFILCEKSENEDSLRLYDQVVVKGKKLYDGKIIS